MDYHDDEDFGNSYNDFRDDEGDWDGYDGDQVNMNLLTEKLPDFDLDDSEATEAKSASEHSQEKLSPKDFRHSSFFRRAVLSYEDFRIPRLLQASKRLNSRSVALDPVIFKHSKITKTQSCGSLTELRRCTNLLDKYHFLFPVTMHKVYDFYNEDGFELRSPVTDDNFPPAVLLYSSFTRDLGTCACTPSLLSGVFHFQFEDILDLARLAYSESVVHNPDSFLDNYGRAVPARARDLFNLKRRRDWEDNKIRHTSPVPKNRRKREQREALKRKRDADGIFAGEGLPWGFLVS